MHEIINETGIIELNVSGRSGGRIDNRHAAFRVACQRTGLGFICSKDIPAIRSISDHIRLDTGFIRFQQLAVIIKDKNLAVLHRIRFLDSHSNPTGRRVNIDAGQVSVAEASGF
ncbi:hypothetical protein D3C75_721480 [compost metagenome]